MSTLQTDAETLPAVYTWPVWKSIIQQHLMDITATLISPGAQWTAMGQSVNVQSECALKVLRFQWGGYDTAIFFFKIHTVDIP